jgi:CheY-like chemotaxis protein/two-component sensor histidine kinase
MTGEEESVLPPVVVPRAFRAQRLQSIGLLAGGIAHDFNNLLGGVLTTLELLLEDVAAPSATREELETIQSALHRGAEIVRELMVYAGEPAAGFEAVDLVPLAEQMIELLHVSVSKRARLNVSFASDLPAVRANRAHLRQLIMNLIVNASEALQGDDGEIFLSLSEARSGESARTGLPCGALAGVRLAVSDTGRGMPDDIRQRIFNPFFSTKAAGRGLGLSVVREIVRAHRGSIHVTSSPGNGSTFEVLLPGVARELLSRNPDCNARAAALDATGPSTVLIVEDEDSLRAAVANLLTRRGFKIIQAADGNSGVRLFRAHQRDIQTVLLDLTLPGVSGREVLQRLRSVRPDIKVVLTSAYTYETVVAGLQDQRPWAFVKKPYRVEELVNLLCAY